MNEALAAASLVILKVAASLFVAMATWLGVRLERLIQTRVKNERVQGLLMRLDNAAVNAVKEIEQAFISNLPAMTPADFAKARAMALASIKVHFGAQGLADLEHDLGLDNTEALEKLLGSVLEARVHDLKAQNSTPAGAMTGAQSAGVTPEKGA